MAGPRPKPSWGRVGRPGEKQCYWAKQLISTLIKAIHECNLHGHVLHTCVCVCVWPIHYKWNWPQAIMVYEGCKHNSIYYRNSIKNASKLHSWQIKYSLEYNIHFFIIILLAYILCVVLEQPSLAWFYVIIAKYLQNGHSRQNQLRLRSIIRGGDKGSSSSSKNINNNNNNKNNNNKWN